MKSDPSKIDIDIDDITSFGPEITHIYNLDPEKWYLYSIHNYSRYVKHEDNNEKMDPEGLVNVNVKLFGLDLNIKPGDELVGKYWWNVLVIHNNMLYVLNEHEVDRNLSFGANLTAREMGTLMAKTKSCEEKYELLRYMPTTIRFY